MKKVLILTLVMALALSVAPAFADEVATESDVMLISAPVGDGEPGAAVTEPLPAVPSGVTGVTVYINNAYLDCSVYGQNAFIKNGRTLVPLRSIFEALGATVEYDESTEAITSTKDDITINLKVGSNKMYVGDNVVELDVPAFVTEANRTMVPVRAISEAFGAKVDWVEATEQVLITTLD